MTRPGIRDLEQGWDARLRATVARRFIMAFFGPIDHVIAIKLLNIMGSVFHWSDGWGPNLDQVPGSSTLPQKALYDTLRALESTAHLESTLALISDDSIRRHFSAANEQRARQLLDKLAPEGPEVDVRSAQTLLGVAAVLPEGATRLAVLTRATNIASRGAPRRT
ncbi:hypothetical protein BE17_10640 [Sorangium cellulosum]|uniref:Uncharacterized protein n=1 Tax=Sorangium cellulosum TaxID=56 RepID=A0A150RA00_SORCE|nr:hypothetical protein BE17_10640 [Sorangium cellulosum]